MRPRKISAINAVMTTMTPLIIWYTEAAQRVKAINIRVDPQMSKAAGIAIRKGLIEPLFEVADQKYFFAA